MSSLGRADLRADLEAHAFGAPAIASLTPRRLGAEAEFIPVETATWRRCTLDGEGPGALLPFVRRYGARQSWNETRTAKGTPCFTLPGGGTITFEPGGQVEYSTPPCRSASALIALLRSVVLPFRSVASSEGITLLAAGIDPTGGAEAAPLLLRTKRYERMAAYLARRGPAGARMMRQTASFQVSLDLDDDPWARWRVLNAAAPYFTAIFANSPVYDGGETGWVSNRARAWRELDVARTGLPWDGRDPLGAYLAFALEAPAIMLPTVNGEHRPFSDWLSRAEPTLDEWHDHLSTLFPEIRPCGHFEVRSADAVAPEWYAAPLALTAGLVYEPRALHAAAELLGAPDLGLLELAGREGLRHGAVARVASDLTEIALDGCRALGPGFFHPADLEQARAFFEHYTRRGRCPADERDRAEVAA